MQFIDEAKIYIQSGKGGAGCVSFRREANIPRGGPDGGDGGRGGHIYVTGVGGLNTLIDYRYQQHFKAKTGQHGMGKNRHGANGEDIALKVPVGTQIFAEDGETLIADIDTLDTTILLAKGGDGGQGNTHFKSSINQAPRRAREGFEGQSSWIWFKLKLLSDIGIIGLPNAGKSSFLRAVSRAHPKVADYPFTTLKPQLGVAYMDEKECVIADIPGLIEGAHEGAGLGIRFLKHIERCRALLHLIDATEENIVHHYHLVRKELAAYSTTLAEKKEIIALNKMDALSAEAIQEKQQALQKACNQPVHLISAISRQGTTDLLRALFATLPEDGQNMNVEQEHV